MASSLWNAPWLQIRTKCVEMMRSLTSRALTMAAGYLCYQALPYRLLLASGINHASGRDGGRKAESICYFPIAHISAYSGISNFMHSHDLMPV